MIHTSKRRPRLTSNAPIYAAMVLIGIGLVVLILAQFRPEPPQAPILPDVYEADPSLPPNPTHRSM